MHENKIKKFKAGFDSTHRGFPEPNFLLNLRWPETAHFSVVRSHLDHPKEISFKFNLDFKINIK